MTRSPHYTTTYTPVARDRPRIHRPSRTTCATFWRHTGGRDYFARCFRPSLVTTNETIATPRSCYNMGCSWYIGVLTVAVAEVKGRVLLAVLWCSNVRTIEAPFVNHVVVVEGFQGRGSFGPLTRAGKAPWARPTHVEGPRRERVERGLTGGSYAHANRWHIDI